mgnify:CR=1 FL=1
MSKVNEYIKMGSLFFILLTIGVFYRRYDDKLIKENIDLHKKLARMEERLVLNAKSKSTRKRTKSQNKTKK